MNHGADDGAMPANVFENIRPIVIAGLAKLAEDVKKLGRQAAVHWSVPDPSPPTIPPASTRHSPNSATASTVSSPASRRPPDVPAPDQAAGRVSAR